MKKIVVGTVVSAKMEKTVVVRVERRLRHPMYNKVIKKYKKYKAHCEDPKIQEGDTVSIQETKPISKNKRFIVVSQAA